jgi:hypothetical protein
MIPDSKQDALNRCKLSLSYIYSNLIALQYDVDKLKDNEVSQLHLWVEVKPVVVRLSELREAVNSLQDKINSLLPESQL